MGANQKEAVAALHRERMLAAAEELFQQKGFEQTTIDDISKASGYITTRFGKISVSYDENTASVTLPEGTDAKIHIPGKEVTITRT